MRQLVQSVRTGELRLVEAPDPVIGPTEVLVRTTHSVVSAGTERMVHKLAEASLLQKARARPDLVRQVLRSARENGVKATLAAARSRLDEETPLGYSGAGVVVEVGSAVSVVRPGMRVATGGAGHGDLQVVAGLLSVPVPDAVSSEQAAFATVASIAIHALRLAELGPGSSIAVVGLGLIGQLTTRLALASGVRVFGIDLRQWTLDRAASAGATVDIERGEATTQAILDWSRGRGVDSVILTAATSSSEPVRLAADRIVDRGAIVVVGDVGLNLDRATLYQKELSLRVARSYGPGRYERAYEEWGVDYPPGLVRFSEGRNLEAVMDLMASGAVRVDELITHRFPIERAKDAYQLLNDDDAHYLGIQFVYGDERPVGRPPSIRRASTGRAIALLGAGAFAKRVLVPAITKSGLGTIASVSSASGTSAAQLAERIGATAAPVDTALTDPNIDIVVIATPHDTHADLTIKALEAGKSVFCEKPLAVTEDELVRVREAWLKSEQHLAAGFNRRHSPDVQLAANVLGKSGGPLVLTYRVSAGRLPPTHWYQDRRQGGRLIGEVCHFIDTCNAIVGEPARDVVAVGRHPDERCDDVALVMSYRDGSVAAITYASGGSPGGSKERLEILGRGHTIVIDDFSSVDIDGKVTRHDQDKGHTRQFEVWLKSLSQGDGGPEEDMFESMSLTFAALHSLIHARGGPS